METKCDKLPKEPRKMKKSFGVWETGDPPIQLPKVGAKVVIRNRRGVVFDGVVQGVAVAAPR